VWELTVRDFFRFLCVKYGNKVFFQGGIADSNWRWLSDKEGFRRWVDGTTGQPLVDANMRELKETGFMSNRGRQNVASYLTQVIRSLHLFDVQTYTHGNSCRLILDSANARRTSTLTGGGVQPTSRRP
jgi:hypothetical protein